MLILREPDQERRRLSSCFAESGGAAIAFCLNEIDAAVCSDDRAINRQRMIFCKCPAFGCALRCDLCELLLFKEPEAEAGVIYEIVEYFRDDLGTIGRIAIVQGVIKTIDMEVVDSLFVVSRYVVCCR